MATNKELKKTQRKADEGLEPRLNRHGKQPHQKLKPYLVLQYLMKRTDEEHTASAFDIIGFLEECGINSDRRSIYKDIEEINIVNVVMEDECSIEEAEWTLDDDPSRKLVCYTHKGEKGFYVNSEERHYDINDVRLLAECVYSAKFLSEGQSKRLASVLCDLVSENQADTIEHDALLTDRVKTNNKQVINNISAINSAMKRDKSHDPEKINFKYLKSSINDISQQVERRKGERYIVSPYKLLINDGNYYLLAFDENTQKMRTYRVDRMKDVRPMGEAREGAEAFSAINLKDYTKRTFSMYGGERAHVRIRFINPLLDTAIERFGTSGVNYMKVDDNHFALTAEVEISDQFFGWLLGFGKRVKLLEPQSAVNRFSAYLDKIREMY